MECVPLARLAAALAAVAIALTAARAQPAPTSAEDPRTIWVLIVKPPEEAKQGVADWLRAYKEFLPSLLANATDRRAGNPSTLMLDILDQIVPSADHAELQKSYASLPSLGVVSAAATSDGSTTFLDQDVYVGPTKGYLTSPFLHFYNAIVPSEYRPSRDAISVVTLYMYAMLLAERHADKVDPYAVCAPLATANTYVGGLDVQAQADLHDLLGAISRELEARKCSG